jgi:spermidine dehydrogenase
MRDRITRRDFLDGLALAVAAGLAPCKQLAAATGPSPPAAYPPSLQGLRGQHAGGFETAHTVVFGGEPASISALPVESDHDCVVVGAGISGLAAAWFYRRRFGDDSRILVLEACDEFGGHARRNEFEVGDRLLLGYGGSEALQSPKANFSAVVNSLLRELGVETDRFRQYFDQSLYPGLGLSRGSFFDRDRFGVDRLVTGDPTDWVADDIPRDRRNGRPLASFIGDFPLSRQAREHLLELYESPRVTLDRFADDEARWRYLAHTSYAQFLRTAWGLEEEAIDYFGGRTLDFFAAPPSRIPALDCALFAYPGFRGIRLPASESAAAEMEEPYIYHFPDGNASIARLLVRSLLPAAIPGRSMEDIVLARADYAALDRPGSRVQIRLGSTVVRVTSGGGHVDVGYVSRAGGRTRRVHSRHAVMACFAGMTPHVVDGLPPEQSAALRLNVKAPLVYTKVLVRHWHPWVRLGVHEIHGVASHHSRVKLDYPVTMGGYASPKRPDEPMVLHLVHVPVVAGIDEPRSALRAARGLMLETPFEAYEEAARRDLNRMLGPGGFDDRRDILGITVNRWSHGYSWGYNSLVDDEATATAMEVAIRPLGRVTIANSDAEWSAYAHAAIDAASRAVLALP